MPADRRRFLVDTFGASVLASLPASLLADSGVPPATAMWDAGQVRHILPTVSDSEMLIKVSFALPQKAAPRLSIGAATVPGRMNDTQGEFWQFHATGLQPGRRYALTLVASNGRPLCDRSDLSTFPSRDSRVDRFRALFFSSAGGHDP
jgi:hypothetical protein